MDENSQGLGVRILQFRMKQLALYSGPVNGKFNEAMVQAVKQMKLILNLEMNADKPEQVKPEIFHLLGDAFWIGARLRKQLKEEPVFLAKEGNNSGVAGPRRSKKPFPERRFIHG